MFITPKLTGRLGNYLFMVAHAKAKSLEYNLPLKIYDKFLSQKQYIKIFNNIEKIDFFPKQNKDNTNPVRPSTENPTIYTGYYQSELFFKNYSKEIMELFSPNIEFLKKIKQKFDYINFDNICCINIRRGDYLQKPFHHPTLSVEYIDHCMEKMQSETYIVISDDIEWCKLNIHNKNIHYIDQEKNHLSAEDTIWLMSLSKNFIISNSSFSWWGAYLSKYEEKKIFCPSCWIGPAFYPRTTEKMNIICDSWISIPASFHNGCLYPQKNEL